MVDSSIAVGYALPMIKEVKRRRPRREQATRGSRISSKNQITLPVAALGAAGLHAGDRVRVDVRGPGELVLIREPSPLAEYAGKLTGVYGPNYLDELRDEWA